MSVVQCVFQSFGQEAKELFVPLSDQLLMRVRKYKYKTKEELFDLWAKQKPINIARGLLEVEKTRRLAGLDNVLGGGIPPLAADLDCGYYICMMCVRKHSAGGTFKPEQHAVFGGDNNFMTHALYMSPLLLIIRKPFRARCQE